jgi:chromosome partitioning protein
VRTIAVTNQKGGVGKTTTVANLGAALAGAGHSVCLVDLDPQANLTTHFGINARSLKRSMYDVLLEPAALTTAAVMVEPNLTVVPATIDLAAAEAELAGAVGREQILRDRLREADLPYELLLVDCPPSLGLLTLNALSAVEEVLIPLQPHFLALQGLGSLLETVELVARRINPPLRVAGVVFCMCESATKLANEVMADVRQFMAEARGRGKPWSEAVVFETAIRRNIKLAECPSYGTTILHYGPHSNGAMDYISLAKEFAAALGLKAPAGQAAPEVQETAEPTPAPPGQYLAQAPAAPENAAVQAPAAPGESAPPAQ